MIEQCSFLTNISAVAFFGQVVNKILIKASICVSCLLFQVESQEYAFAMRKNSPWLNEINLALSAVINNGIVLKSYAHHTGNQCPPLTKGESVSALTLSNFGSLFAIVVVVAVILTALKLYFYSEKRQRPSLPMRSLASQEDCLPTNGTTRDSSLLFENGSDKTSIATRSTGNVSFSRKKTSVAFLGKL